MGILDRLRAAIQDAIHQDWKVLDSIDQLDHIVKISHTVPVVLFKHSVRCGISSAAKHRLQQAWDFNTDELAFYYLDLLEHRDVSNEIARRFEVIHQSPQVILIKNGQVIHHNSHHGISVTDLRQALSA